MRNEPEPSTRPGYLLAAALIWAAIVASLVAGPPASQAQLAMVSCRSSPSP